jgi:thioredoxin-related protein
MRNAVRMLASVMLIQMSTLAFADWESTILPRDFQSENSLVKALDSAKQSGRSAIVYYTRTNCPPCNVLQGRLRKEDVAKPYRDMYVFTAVWGSSMGNAERERYRAEFGVEGAPTWIFFRNDGTYVCTASGGFRSDQAGMELHQIVQSKIAEPSRTSAAIKPLSCL